MMISSLSSFIALLPTKVINYLLPSNSFHILHKIAKRYGGVHYTTSCSCSSLVSSSTPHKVKHKQNYDIKRNPFDFSVL